MNYKIHNPNQENQTIRKSWKMFLIRGIFMSVIGTILLLFPVAGFSFAAIVFAVFIAVDGIVHMIVGFRLSESARLWWGTVLRGVIEIIVSAILLSHPAGFGKAGASALIVIVGTFFVIAGVLDYQFNRGRASIANSVILVILGILLLALPVFSLTLLLRAAGGAALISGTGRIIGALANRKKSVDLH